MEMNFDMLTQIPKLLRELIAIVQEPLEERRKRRKAFFNDEIKPIHIFMEAINKDYMKSFAELLELLKSQNDVVKTIELLKVKRLVLIGERQDVLAYSEELKNVKKRGYIKKREISAFVDYADSIKKYFEGASPVDTRVSWYSDFICEFEAIARRGDSPFQHEKFESIESSGSPIELVKKAYSDALHSDIPEVWKQYLGAFHKLRLELNR